VSETKASLLLGAIFVTGCLVLAHFTASHARWSKEDREPACGRSGCTCKICDCRNCKCGRRPNE
jgi:hypothetical protein